MKKKDNNRNLQNYKNKTIAAKDVLQKKPVAKRMVPLFQLKQQLRLLLTGAQEKASLGGNNKFRGGISL